MLDLKPEWIHIAVSLTSSDAMTTNHAKHFIQTLSVKINWIISDRLQEMIDTLSAEDMSRSLLTFTIIHRCHFIEELLIHLTLHALFFHLTFVLIHVFDTDNFWDVFLYLQFNDAHGTLGF